MLKSQRIVVQVGLRSLMSTFITKTLYSGAIIVGGVLLPAAAALSQGLDVSQPLQTDTEAATDAAVPRPVGPVFTLEQSGSNNNTDSFFNTGSVNLGVDWVSEPVPGLNLSAGAWLNQMNQRPSQQRNLDPAVNFGLPQLGTESAQDQPMALDNVLPGTSLESNGVDLGASYAWELDNIGQFTLSTKATYVNDFSSQNGVISGFVGGLTDESQLIASPELQGSLTLTWSLGNHSASAVTNYFDSFKNIDELNIEEINQLVDDITTVDLQYGYTVKQGKQNRAIISFGIKNVFDKKTVQILNQNNNAVDQKGRVAYGSIKYQF